MKFGSTLGMTAILCAGLLAGCSDHPTEGTVDTALFSNKIKVIDVTGSVYGAKAGIFDLIESRRVDLAALKPTTGDRRFSYPDEVFKALQDGSEMPSLDLVFPQIDGLPDMSGIEDAIQGQVKAFVAAEKAAVEEDLAEWRETVAEQEAKIAKMESDQKEFEEGRKAAKQNVEAVLAKLNGTIDRYNALSVEGVSALNAVLSDAGVKGQFSDDFLTRYREISYEGKAKPSSCPKQRRNVAINLLDAMETCVYLRDVTGNEYGQHKSRFVSTAKDFFVKMNAMRLEIGEQRSWNSKATGLRAAYAEAKSDYERKQNPMAMGVPNAYAYKSMMANSKRYIAMTQEKIAEAESPDYLKARVWSEDNQMLKTSSPHYDDSATRERVFAYMDATREHIEAQIVKVTPLQFDAESEDGVFSDFSGDFHAGAAISGITMEARGERETVYAVSVLDMTDPKVLIKDSLTFDIDRKDAERRLDMDDEAEIRNKIFRKLVRLDRPHTEA